MLTVFINTKVITESKPKSRDYDVFLKKTLSCYCLLENNQSASCTRYKVVVNLNPKGQSLLFYIIIGTSLLNENINYLLIFALIG